MTDRLDEKLEPAPLKRGDRVWALGEVRAVYGDSIDVAFAPWWPPWASVLAPAGKCRAAADGDEPPGAAPWPG